MIEVRDEKLFIDGHSIGTEEEILALINKANCFDELNTFFKGGA